MASPFRSFEADIFDFASRNRLSTVCTTVRDDVEPYSIGEEFVVSDSIAYKNNSKRIRKCIIREIEKVSGKKYNIYVEPTKEDLGYKRLDLGPIDRDGEDGWLEK